jgi:hypothetical protein
MFLWKCYTIYDRPGWIRWISFRWLALVLRILSAVFLVVLTGLIAANKGPTEAWKITTLSLFVTEYILLYTLYLWKTCTLGQAKGNGCKELMCGQIPSNIFGKERMCVHCILRWSTFTCAIGWILAVVSLSLYLFGRISYIISLWVSNNVIFSLPKTPF